MRSDASGSNRPGPLVHPTAIVEEGSSIGDRTRIWHHSHIRSGAVIGSDCTIGMNVYVDSGALIGNRCKIQNNVSVYRGVELGDDVLVGPSAVFTNDRLPRASNESWQITPTHVGPGASIGANATIVCGVRIGEWAMIGAGAVITSNVLAHELVAGVPGHRLGWVCRYGHVLERTQTTRTVSLCPACGWEFPF